ncbi:MAG: hypothetical protein HOM79_01680, partial [Alphaproteobacteria bacterium]|nr:hypothetical protein [Alphaproteobacteria bacterium]
PRKKPPCPDDYYNWFAPHSPEFLCPQGEGYNTGLYTIIGGPDTNSDMPVEIGINLVDKQEVSGLNPRKIGNIRQFDYGCDAITLFVGHMILRIYKWTGVNFFRETESNQLERSMQ